MWYIDGTSIKRTHATTGLFPLNYFAVMLIKALSGTGIVGWYDKKSGFITNFLSTCDKFRNSRGFNFGHGFTLSKTAGYFSWCFTRMYNLYHTTNLTSYVNITFYPYNKIDN